MEEVLKALASLESFMGAKNNLPFFVDNDSMLIDYKKDIISKDICIYHGLIHFKNTLHVNENPLIEGLCIDVTMDGQFNFLDNTTGVHTQKTKNTTLVNFINRANIDVTGKKDESIRNVSIIVGGNFLERFFLSQINPDNALKNYTKNITTAFKHTNYPTKTTLLAKEILSPLYNKNLEHIFLKGKVYEIIYNELAQIIAPKSKNLNIKFSKDDIHSLYRARDLICKEHCFANIPKLCKKVALNEFKLKYGFRHFFNTSVGAMILEQRLMLAKKLLKTTELSVQEISSLVGYKHVQSFSNAFRAKFKVSPKEMMKSRNYYF